ncbi:hypothetical protein PENTCL1PPCAC_30076, partial [Pristionchus entomophagus]
VSVRERRVSKSSSLLSLSLPCLAFFLGPSSRRISRTMAPRIAAILAVLCAGALAQGGTQGCQPHPTCNLDDLARCQSTFNKDIGIPQALDVKKYDQLQDAVESLIGTQGIDELGRVCYALRSLKFCFTDPQHYDNCFFNPLGLVGDDQCQATGITEKQARGYVRFYASLDFACGVGFSHYWNAEQTPTTIGCMSNVFANKLDDLRKCQDSFDTSVAADNMNACPYVSEASKCYQRAFSKCIDQGQWFGCEYELVGLQAAYGNCGQDFCK